LKLTDYNLKKQFQLVQELEDISKELGVSVVKIINPKDIVVDIRARFKCRSCKRYGKKCTCPPNIPDVAFFKELFSSYHFGLIVCIKRKVKQKKWKEVGRESSMALHKILLKLEQHAFNRGCIFATSFIGGSCKLCSSETCSLPCKDSAQSRIPLEATGVNVVETCRRLNIDITFPVSLNKVFWRIGLLLVI